jgi:gas vesicle protein
MPLPAKVEIVLTKEGGVMAERPAHNNTLMATMLAGVVGAAAGILFAPHSGRETRQQLRGKATGLKDRASQTLHRADDKED